MHTLHHHARRHLIAIPGSVHITSDDHDPAIDFLFEVTPDCVAENPTTTVAPTTTAALNSAVPTTPTVATPTVTTPTRVGGAGGELPATGGANWFVASLAAVLVACGLVLSRATRRA